MMEVTLVINGATFKGFIKGVAHSPYCMGLNAPPPSIECDFNVCVNHARTVVSMVLQPEYGQEVLTAISNGREQRG